MPKTQTQRGPKGFLGKVTAFGSRNLYVWMAFLVPLALMLTAFGLMDVSPFGQANQQILVTDLWHQYYPFLADFQYKLQHGESLFWTWSVGSGVNYFSLMSYYLASPMNFLSVFVSSDWLREFLMISVAVKIALAGSFMALFLRSVFKRNDVSLIIFGVIKLVGYFSRDLFRLAFQYDWQFGILLLVLGVIVLLHRESTINFLCTAGGVAILVEGLFKIQISLDARKFGITSWWTTGVVALLCCIAGVLLILRPASGASVLQVLFGIALAQEGVLNLLVALSTVKIAKNQRPDVLEAEYAEY